VQRLAQPSGHVWAEVANEALASVANFVDSQHDARLGVVVVVTNGNTPGNEFGVFIARWKVAVLERVVVNRSAHGASLTDCELGDVLHSEQ
jgi:hypothetical protein